jgi:DNA replication licensing factor MCM2
MQSISNSNTVTLLYILLIYRYRYSIATLLLLLLLLVQDMVDPVVDEQLATFVVGSHMRSHPDHDPAQDDGDNDGDNGTGPDGHMGDADSEDGNDGGEDGIGNSAADAKKRKLGAADLEEGPQPIDQALLKKYIIFARSTVKPALRQLDTEKVCAMCIVLIIDYC